MRKCPEPSVALLIIALLASLIDTITGTLAGPAPPRPSGFWKEKTGSGIKGEFAGEDPIGLSAGKHIPTNCSIHHAFDGGKIYCFSSLPSLEYLDSNRELLDQAKAFWAKEHPTASH